MNEICFCQAKWKLLIKNPILTGKFTAPQSRAQGAVSQASFVTARGDIAMTMAVWSKMGKVDGEFVPFMRFSLASLQIIQRKWLEWGFKLGHHSGSWSAVFVGRELMCRSSWLQ